MKNNLTRLRKLIASHLGVEKSEVKLESDFVKELGADSLDVIELVMLIEYEFEIEEIDDIVASKIATVQDALYYIEGNWDKIK